MNFPRRRLIAAAAAFAALVPATAAQGATRQPIRDCGDVSTLDEGGFFIRAITAQGSAWTLVHRENARQTTFIRLEFGS